VCESEERSEAVHKEILVKGDRSESATRINNSANDVYLLTEL